MTRCQLAALTKDRVLFVLSLSRLAHKRTTPDTHTKQLVLQPHLRQKVKSNLQSPACFHNRVQQRPQTVARTASPHSARWQICLVKSEQNTEHRQRRAQRWIKPQRHNLQVTTECIFIDQCVRFHVCHCCSWTICVMSCNSYGSIRPEKPQRTSSDCGTPLQIQVFPKDQKRCIRFYWCLIMEWVNEENMDCKGSSEMIWGTWDREV